MMYFTVRLLIWPVHLSLILIHFLLQGLVGEMLLDFLLHIEKM